MWYCDVAKVRVLDAVILAWVLGRLLALRSGIDFGIIHEHMASLIYKQNVSPSCKAGVTGLNSGIYVDEVCHNHISIVIVLAECIDAGIVEFWRSERELEAERECRAERGGCGTEEKRRKV